MDYYPLNLIFTQKDLYWLDQLMPGKKKTDVPTQKGLLERGVNGCRSRGGKNEGYVVNGKQDAAKFVRFNKLPPVLQISLQRYEFDLQVQ